MLCRHLIVDELEKELKVGFLDEASQLIEDAEQCFLEIEVKPKDEQIIDKLFRLAHNLKGSAKAVGFEELGRLTHKLESLLLKIKNKELSVQSKIVNLLLRCKDEIHNILNLLKSDLSAQYDSSPLVQELEAMMNAQPEAEEPIAAPTSVAEPAPQSIPEVQAAEKEETIQAEDVKAFENFRAQISQQEEQALLATQDNVPTAQEVIPLAPVKKPTPPKETADENVRVSLKRLDKLINYVGEMVILQAVLGEQTSIYSENPLIRKSVHQLGKVSKEIQDISMSLRMVPLKQTFQKMQRIVRDTSSMLDKKVNFTITGEDTELDKTVLELIGDPLVHLIRNAVDHGIDTKEQRAAAGKAEMGQLSLSAHHHASSIIIEVKDDGRGVDPQRIKQKAIEKGILKPNVTISDKEALHLIFAPGFSTKAEVTDISGRGVGLDVVKTNIEKLQGSVDITSEVNKGTTFRIQLPLTLAIIEAMIVKVGQNRFVIPKTQVHESLKLEAKNIHHSVNAGDIYHLRGENLSMWKLSQLMAVSTDQKMENSILIVVRAEGEPFSVLVDDIIGIQQIVIKKLGSELQAYTGLSGSAILGDGKPALILDLPQLIQRKSPKTKSAPARMSV